MRRLTRRQRRVSREHRGNGAAANRETTMKRSPNLTARQPSSATLALEVLALSTMVVLAWLLFALVAA